MSNKIFKDKTSKERVAKFFDREGFYIILFLCVCIVAITAVWVSRSGIKNNNANNEDKKPVVESQEKETTTTQNDDGIVKPTIPVADNTDTAKKNDSSVTPAAPSVQNKETKTNVKTNNVATTIKLDSPLKDGLNVQNIVKEFSPDDLVCFESMNEWRTHMGIDIKALQDTDVLASYGGKVVDVRNDNDSPSGLGWTVVIDHNNGYRTVYSNLGEKPQVSKNQTVKKGQKIGAIGNTSISEKDTAVADIPVSHLHFELLKKNGKSYENIDPEKYLPVQK